MVAENASGSLARRCVHGPGIDEPLLRYEGSGTYSPYGEQSMATVSFGYTGQQKFAEVGSYYKSRFYYKNYYRLIA